FGMKLVAIVLLAVFGTALYSQTVAHAKGMAHVEQVDIAYQTLSSRETSLPIIAVNGGPGLTHAYMVQNDLWDRVARNRMVVFYDQRGTGASKPGQSSASLSQTMDAQVAD